MNAFVFKNAMHKTMVCMPKIQAFQDCTRYFFISNSIV